MHAGFSGFRAFVARKKGRCKLIGNRFVIPHDTIPSNVVHKCKKDRATLKVDIKNLNLRLKKGLKYNGKQQPDKCKKCKER